MPITYEHRVPASTLGGLALAAGQEQYEAKRGLEERERAMQLAQMAQQQQMQNERMEYDAASTMYRTMADYDKFVMSAQLDVQRDQQNQQNRLALQNNQEQLGAGREEVRWDRAEKQAGQQDTFAAWNNYVTSTLPGLNPDGKDILNTHAGKVRTIMSNQKFNRTQKSAAISQVLEEVQGLGLDQNYAMEQMYEPGKTYNNATGETFLWDGKKAHLQGRHYDGLIKPDDMSDADWMGGGRNKAWMDKYTVEETRDEDGKRVRHFISNGEMISRVDEDDQYRREQQKIKDDAMRIEDEKLLVEHRDKKAAWASDYLDAMNEASPIKMLMGPNDELLSSEEKLAELERRRKKAQTAADIQFSEEPPRRAPPAAMGVETLHSRSRRRAPPAAMGGGGAGEVGAFLGDQPGRMSIPSAVGSATLEPGGWMGGGSGPIERPPIESPKDEDASPMQMIKRITANIDDPRARGIAEKAARIYERGGAQNLEEEATLREAENIILENLKQTNRALEENVSLGMGGTATFGEAHAQKMRRRQALALGEEHGGTGDIFEAKKMAGGPGELWNVPSSPYGVLWGEEFVNQIMNPEKGTKPSTKWIGQGPPGGWNLAASKGDFPGELEPKVPFERTQEQTRSEQELREIQKHSPERVESRPTLPVSITSPVPISEFKRPEGEGRVGAAGGSTAPEGVSFQTESLRKARGEKPYSKSELADIAYRSRPKGREISKEEQLQDRIKDPKTVKKALFSELWPETKTVKGKVVPGMDLDPGETGPERTDRIYDALDEWDLHTPRMTKEKFAKRIADDADFRSSYQSSLDLKLMIKEGRHAEDVKYGVLTAKARQARFEEQYRAQRKADEAEGK